MGDCIAMNPKAGDDTRSRIMAAAAEVFACKGYAGATTRALAAAAGVNEVTLFRHFGSKKNLFSTILDEMSALPALDHIVAEQMTGDYRRDLIRLGSLTKLKRKYCCSGRVKG